MLAKDGFTVIAGKVTDSKLSRHVERIMETKPGAQSLDIAWEVWRLKLENFTTLEISERVGVPIREIHRLLMDCMEYFKEDLQEMVTIVREQDLQRTEALLKPVMKLAGMESVTLQRMVKGEPVEFQDAELPIKASAAAVRIMTLRAKLMGLDNTNRTPSPTMTYAWIEQEMQHVRDATPQELVLECESEKLG